MDGIDGRGGVLLPCNDVEGRRRNGEFVWMVRGAVGVLGLLCRWLLGSLVVGANAWTNDREPIVIHQIIGRPYR